MKVEADMKKMGYPSQLAVLLSLTGGGLILSVIASLLTWLIMEGVSMPSTAAGILKPQYYGVNMIIQLISTFFIFFLPVIGFAFICYWRPKSFLGFNLNINFKQVLLVILILMITVPVVGSLSQINKILPLPSQMALKFKAMESARELQEAALININSASKYLISLLVIALAPAVFEETFFRAGMQNLLTKWFKGPWVAIIVSSIIFSLIHLSYYGFLVRFALGVILGLIFYFSGSIWLSVLFHFLVNGVQVTILYFMSFHKSLLTQNGEANFPLWPLVPGILILFYLFNVFKKISLTQRSKVIPMANEEQDFYEWSRNIK